MEHPVDYFIVHGYWQEWYLNRQMAQAIEQSIDATPAPEWVTFVDLVGARVRSRARLINCVAQCTAEQRAPARAFERARNAEDEE